MPVAELIVGSIELATTLVKAVSGKRLLTGGAVRKVEKQLAQVKEKLESAKEELYQVGKDILDYKDLYRKATDSMRDCAQLKQTLNVCLSQRKYKKAPEVLHEVVSKAYGNLDESIGELESNADALDVKANDPVIERVKYIKEDLHDLEIRLNKKRYGVVLKDVGRIESKLRDMERTITSRMYDKITGVVKTLKT